MRRPTRALAALTGLALGASALVSAPAVDAAGAFCYGVAVTNTTTTNASGAIIGTPGRDVIRGTPGDDVIFGAAGNDIICGDGGNDVIHGQRGWDILIGNDGDDTIRGGPGRDQLLGSNGNDKLFGDTQNDRLFGHAGDDLLAGADGDDAHFAGPGNDDLRGGTGDDDVRGDAGRDVCRGGAGTDDASNCEIDYTSENPFPIMLIGDGTTGGASGQDSYRPELVQKLRAANCDVNLVGRSAGHNPTATSPAINWNVDQSHEAKLGGNIAPATGQVRAALAGYTRYNTPKLVVIQLGANDMFQWKDPQLTAGNIEAIIAQLRATYPGVKVVVSSIFPLDRVRIMAQADQAVPSNLGMAAYNNKIRAVAQTKADGYVNIHTGLFADQYSPDGIVPNSAGEAIIAQRMFANMRPHIPGC